jgi:hypothetical protein
MNASLSAKVMPNPSSVAFTVSLQGKLNLPISVRVTDMLGRVIETRTGLQVNTQLSFGQNWKSGVYFLQVMQGAESKTIKLVKE